MITITILENFLKMRQNIIGSIAHILLELAAKGVGLSLWGRHEFQ
jgi:hypothetical protein